MKKNFVETSFGNIAYLESGSDKKPPVLFVHGIPTSSYLWRDVIRFLQNDLHCYAPDLMGLGDTEVDPKTTAFHMDAQAEMLIELMEKLGHETYGLVCHDQGGAAAEILVGRLPQRVNAWVITDSVCYDNWPVPAIKQLQDMSRIPLLMNLVSRTGIMEWLECDTRLSNFKRGVFERDKLSNESIREYLRPLRESAVGRERFLKFLLAGNARYSELAVAGIKQFDKPTLIIWAGDDHYLSPSWGRKLLEDIPGAERLEIVPFCGHFWQEERPSEFASLMGEFLVEKLASAKKTVSTTGKKASAKHNEKKGRASKKTATSNVVTEITGS